MPYEPREAHGFTRKANTGSRSRQWTAVYESSRRRGDDEGTAITKAQGVVKKNWQKTNPARRKPSDRRPEHMKAAGQINNLTKAPGVGGKAKVLKPYGTSDRVAPAPKPTTPNPTSIMKPAGSKTAMAVSYGQHASTSIGDMAKAIAEPERPPGRVGRWKRMLDRMLKRTGQSEQKVNGLARRTVRTALGRDKTALRSTSRTRLRGLRESKKVPTVKATEVQDLGKHMTAEAKRMSLEGGKGPIVSRKKLWARHSKRGGRLKDVSESFESSRTFTAAPIGDQPGVKTVQFKDKPSGAKKSPAAKKAKRKPAGKK